MKTKNRCELKAVGCKRGKVGGGGGGVCGWTQCLTPSPLSITFLPSSSTFQSYPPYPPPPPFLPPPLGPLPPQSSSGTPSSQLTPHPPSPTPIPTPDRNRVPLSASQPMPGKINKLNLLTLTSWRNINCVSTKSPGRWGGGGRGGRTPTTAKENGGTHAPSTCREGKKNAWKGETQLFRERQNSSHSSLSHVNLPKTIVAAEVSAQ